MGHEVIRKEDLNPQDYLIEVKAPLVAEKLLPGHFVVLMTHPKGERIPMSVQKAENGNVTLFIKRLGKTSVELDKFKVGDCLENVIGPLGTPIDVKKYGNVVVCSDLVCGHAENYSICKALRQIKGNHVISMQTFPSKNMIYLEKELREVSDEYYITLEDGSYGIKGHYRDVLEKMLKEGKIDMVFAGGKMDAYVPLAKLTKEYNVPAMVTLRPIMVDATGMCGSCRVFVDGEMKLACVDGPMFDAHKINYEELLNRVKLFKKQEETAFEDYKKKVN
ncbi:MAG: sulfide/dihydroorotate dehydrogenase-like FAD/NAD-binding protein [Candidatus Bathyarchaeota archaeon]|nr:sulfide/dihydroorotate dehydrogenase-like FAD/NAD-binding protein [Candidatus Bathyarchaeota archaeon]